MPGSGDILANVRDLFSPDISLPANENGLHLMYHIIPFNDVLGFELFINSLVFGN